MTGTVLVTGGAGYIGSHACVALTEAGYEVVVLDNLCNSSAVALERLQEICDRSPVFIQGDIRDRDCLDRIFQTHTITAVLHFAGLKAVGESVDIPLQYYDSNVAGSLVLLAAMQHAGVRNLVFSSSATVNGESVPVMEDSYGLSAIRVPSGRHSVVLRGPPPPRTSLTLAVMALIGLFAAVAVPGRRRATTGT